MCNSKYLYIYIALFFSIKYDITIVIFLYLTFHFKKVINSIIHYLYEKKLYKHIY